MRTLVQLLSSARAAPGIVTMAIACAMLATTGFAATPKDKPPPKPQGKTARYPLGGMPESARRYYAMTWGVDEMSAKLAESGQVVRFSYRVIDATRAKALQDKAATPNMLDEARHAVLTVPVMEKVGPLRQSTPAENGKSYWMVFSNKGNIVKRDHKVSVVIGPFRVDGLIVQ